MSTTTDSDVTSRLPRLMARTAPFLHLSDEQRDRLLREMLVAYFEEGRRILEAGPEAQAYLYLVASGSVRLVHGKTGELIDCCGEGDAFGSWGLLRREPRPYHAVAAENTTCALIPAAAFHEVFEAQDDFATFFKEDLKAYAGQRDVHKREASSSRMMFGTKLGDLIHRDPVTCPPDMAVREAARRMRDERVGSILVTEEGVPCGMLTNSDLRDKVVAGEASLDTPVRALMNAPIVSLPRDHALVEGLLAMAHHRMHHLVITANDEPGAPVLGVISSQDVAHARGEDPATTVQHIERATSVEALAHIRSKTTTHLLRLHEQGVQAEDLIRINTEINDRLTERALGLVEARLREEHPGDEVARPWVWMSLGSEGRREMSLKTDQDNGLIYADPSDEAEAKRAEAWYRQLAGQANEALAVVGFELCPGDVMARNPKWRQPLAGWKRTFRRWVLEPSEEALLNANIFFDMRALYGAEPLVGALQEDLGQALDQERGFLPFLMKNALQVGPPLTFFRRFVLEQTGEQRATFDVKRRGLALVVDLARVLALEARYFDSCNTVDRLRHAAEALPGVAETATNLVDAYQYLVQLRLEHQIGRISEGEEPDNHIDPTVLTKPQQQILKVIFSTIKDAQESLSYRYGAHMMRH